MKKALRLLKRQPLLDLISSGRLPFTFENSESILDVVYEIQERTERSLHEIIGLEWPWIVKTRPGYFFDTVMSALNPSYVPPERDSAEESRRRYETRVDGKYRSKKFWRSRRARYKKAQRAKILRELFTEAAIWRNFEEASKLLRRDDGLYWQVRIHPFSGMLTPQCPCWYRRAVIKTLVDIYEDWYRQTEEKQQYEGEPYVRIVIHPAHCTDDTCIEAAFTAGRVEFYENVFQPEFPNHPLPSEYLQIPGIEKLEWESRLFRDDEDDEESAVPLVPLRFRRVWMGKKRVPAGT